MKFITEETHMELIELMRTRPSIVVGELKELGEEIESKIFSIWAADRRCWWTCIKLVKSLNKKWRKNLVLAESKNHYWLEYKGNVICPHYFITGHVMYLEEYKAQKINEMPISQVLAGVRPLSEGYEEIRAVKANGEGEKYIKIPSIEL